MATFTSAYPHGFSPLRHVEQIYTGQEVIVLEQDGDETEEYVRPYIVITPENEDIAEMTITNQDTEDIIKIKNIKKGEELTIDCENKIVYSNNEYRVIGSDFYGVINGQATDYPVWLQLAPGNNRLKLNPGSDTCKVKYVFKYRYSLKVGGTY